HTTFGMAPRTRAGWVKPARRTIPKGAPRNSPPTRASRGRPIGRLRGPVHGADPWGALRSSAWYGTAAMVLTKKQRILARDIRVLLVFPVSTSGKFSVSTLGKSRLPKTPNLGPLGWRR